MNTLIMRIDAPYSLNFLIYIQNSYLNQQTDSTEYKFPYKSTPIHFSNQFESHFKNSWDDLSSNLSESNRDDLKLYHNDDYFIPLFLDDSNGVNDYKEIRQTFNTWWGSFAGRFSIERSIDAQCDNLYAELVNELTISPHKESVIHLLYDDYLLHSPKKAPYSVVFSIKDFYVRFDELSTELINSMS